MPVGEGVDGGIAELRARVMAVGSVRRRWLRHP